MLSTSSLSPMINFFDKKTLEIKMSFFKQQPRHRDKTSKQTSNKKGTNRAKKELLKINELPSFARLCLNVIMVEDTLISGRVTSWRSGYVIGSASTPIFDAQKNLKYGALSLNLWPFEAFDPRMVCLGECNTHLKGAPQDNPLCINLFFDTKSNVKWGLKPDLVEHLDS